MKQNGKKRSISWKKLIGILLFLSLLFSHRLCSGLHDPVPLGGACLGTPMPR